MVLKKNAIDKATTRVKAVTARTPKRSPAQSNGRRICPLFGDMIPCSMNSRCQTRPMKTNDKKPASNHLFFELFILDCSAGLISHAMTKGVKIKADMALVPHQSC